jgi:chorismate dehydratase
MQKKIRIGAVSYLNTKPLIYGFEHGAMKDKISLELNYPSLLAAALQKNNLDIALLPVAAIPSISNAHVVSPYGIAAAKKVASVCLFSQVPIEEIQEIYLDYQSRTSVALLRILLRDHWQTRPMLLDAPEDYISSISDKTAGIIIGDRALEQLNHFDYVYDLAEAWHEHTQLPFVFAAWVAMIPVYSIDGSLETGIEGAGYGGTFHARYILTGKENSTISVGTHTTLGYVGESSTDGGSYSAGIVDVPVVIEYNLGHNASYESTVPVGLYVGGGYGFNTSFVSGFGSFTTHGPVVDFGFRYRLFGRTAGFHFSLLKSLNYKDTYLAGVGLIQGISRGEGSGGYRSNLSGGDWPWIY